MYGNQRIIKYPKCGEMLIEVPACGPAGNVVLHFFRHWELDIGHSKSDRSGFFNLIAEISFSDIYDLSIGPIVRRVLHENAQCPMPNVQFEPLFSKRMRMSYCTT